MNNWTDKHYDRIWSRLHEMFGHRFTKDYGDTPNETWREALSGLTFEPGGTCNIGNCAYGRPISSNTGSILLPG